MWLPLVLLLLALPAMAQVPVCNSLREGMTACFDGRLCRCRFEAGGQLTGRAEGHRWDCGALRPDCRPTEPQTPWPQIAPQIYLDGSRLPLPRKPTSDGAATPPGTR